MHIVLIPHQFYPDSYGGVETVTYRLANHLVARGHRVNILCHHFSNDETGDIKILDETYENLPIRRLSYNPKYRSVEAEWTLRDEDVTRQVEVTFDEWEPEIVHPLGVSLITTASIVASRKRGIPVICSITNYESICRRGNLVKGDGALCCGQQSFRKCWKCTHPSSAWNDLGYRILSKLPRIVVVALAEINRRSPRPLATLEIARLVDLRLNQLLPSLHKVDVHVVISNWMRKVLLLNGISEEHIFVSPRGVASSLVPYAKTKTDHIRFGYLGRINYDKGIHIAIRAFQALQRPQEGSLTIFGKPTNIEEQAYAQTLHHLARDEPSIYFAGHIRADEVAQALKDIDVLLVPSIWHEPFGQVNIEAIATGTPVIASNIGGIPEIIRDGVSGFLFPPGDVQALSKKMQRFVDEPALRTEIANNAQSWRSFEEEAQFFTALYEQLRMCTLVELDLNNV